jgi:ribosomal protein S18 acetylase RimI-like enzyme
MYLYIFHGGIPLIIRKANQSDAIGIARVHVDSWRTTYKDIIPSEFLEKLSYEQRTALWNRNISKEDHYVFVAVSTDGEIVGFADCGKREANNLKDTCDLTSIYLLKEYQGKGVGKQLLKALFNQFEKLKVNKVFVEVLEENKTRFFYEYYGARLLRKNKISIAGTELALLIYEWDNPKEVLSKLV